MPTSGETAITTNTDGYKDLIPADPNDNLLRMVVIINTGSVAGFFSLDGGQTSNFMPGPCNISLPIPQIYKGVKVKRINGGGSGDLSGMYGWAV